MSSFPGVSIDIGERPAIGQDLLLIQQSFGFDKSELGAALGLNSVKAASLLDERAGEPIADPTIALLVWMVLKYPEYCSLPIFPSPAEVFEVYEKVVAGMPRDEALWMDSKMIFGVLLGRDGIRGHRWLSQNMLPKAVYPQTRRLLYAFQQLLLARGEAGLREWRARVEAEASSRGNPNIWSSKNWKAAPPPKPRKRRQYQRRTPRRRAE